MAGFSKSVLTNVTTGTSTPVRAHDGQYITLYAHWSPGVTAGVVTLEAAATENFSGTWASLGTTSFTANAVTRVSVTGPAPYVRARVSTTVAGGTVSVWIDVSGTRN